MIRSAEYQDIPDLIAMGREMHAASRYRVLPFAPEKLSELLLVLITEGSMGIVLVAEDQGRIVGAMIGMCNPFWASEALVATDLALYVDPITRGMGVAKALACHFRSHAEKRGAVLVQVGSTTGLPGASDLYRSIGFKAVGEVLAWEAEHVHGT